MDITVHHENPNTYPDTWEDCLVVGEGGIENAETAEYWGGPKGATMVSLCDYTDGPQTRVRYLATDDETIKQWFPKGSKFRLKPDEQGGFIVSDYHEGQGVSDCVIMRQPGLTIAAASVEKWVPRELKDELFPIGRRFGLEPIVEGV